MAPPVTTVTLLKATQYSAVYAISAQYGATNALIDYRDAATLAGLVEGPLKRDIVRHLAAGTLARFNLDGLDSARVRIYNAVGLSGVIYECASTSIVWSANGLVVSAQSGAELPAGTFRIEIRFIHSKNR